MMDKKCIKCDHWNWISLKELDGKMCVHNNVPSNTPSPGCYLLIKATELPCSVCVCVCVCVCVDIIGDLKN